MQYAHDKGILHRDLKPHNIMIDEQSDRPLLTDFGLAKIIDHGHELTMAGEIMGTPAYMSPRASARDAGKVSFAADQYSLGTTLYHLLTARPPFQSGGRRRDVTPDFTTTNKSSSATTQPGDSSRFGNDLFEVSAKESAQTL
ncbi:MAG: protein kinase [Pirellulales bacterium]